MKSGNFPLFHIVGGVMEEKVKRLIEEPIVNAGYLLDSVTYKKENGNYFLRIVIDKKDDYITVNDCVEVNNLLDPILDEMEFLTDSYIVDICSKEKGCE